MYRRYRRARPQCPRAEPVWRSGQSPSPSGSGDTPVAIVCADRFGWPDEDAVWSINDSLLRVEQVRLAAADDDREQAAAIGRVGLAEIVAEPGVWNELGRKQGEWTGGGRSPRRPRVTEKGRVGVQLVGERRSLSPQASAWEGQARRQRARRRAREGPRAANRRGPARLPDPQSPQMPMATGSSLPRPSASMIGSAMSAKPRRCSAVGWSAHSGGPDPGGRR